MVNFPDNETCLLPTMIGVGKSKVIGATRFWKAASIRLLMRPSPRQVTTANGVSRCHIHSPEIALPAADWV